MTWKPLKSVIVPPRLAGSGSESAKNGTVTSGLVKALPCRASLMMRFGISKDAK